MKVANDKSTLVKKYMQHCIKVCEVGLQCVNASHALNSCVGLSIHTHTHGHTHTHTHARGVNAYGHRYTLTYYYYYYILFITRLSQFYKNELQARI